MGQYYYFIHIAHSIDRYVVGNPDDNVISFQSLCVCCAKSGKPYLKYMHISVFLFWNDIFKLFISNCQSSLERGKHASVIMICIHFLT
jgi:hypothetical protein